MKEMLPTRRLKSKNSLELLYFQIWIKYKTWQKFQMLFNKILKKIASCESTSKEVLFESSNITSHVTLSLYSPRKWEDCVKFYNQNFTLKLVEKVLFCPTVLDNEWRWWFIISNCHLVTDCYEKIWSLYALESKQHRRTGRGARGAAAPSPLPPNFGRLRFFGQQEKIGAKPVFKDVSMCFLLL